MDGLSKYFMGFGLGVALGVSLGISSINKIPNNSVVQNGFIAPSRLEITCTDLDRNGELETVMNIEGKSYLLREVDGKPVLSDYFVEDPKIVYNN